MEHVDQACQHRRKHISDHFFIVGLRARSKAFTPASLGPRLATARVSPGLAHYGRKGTAWRNINETESYLTIDIPAHKIPYAKVSDVYH
jgi:hypothetical protein